MIDTKEQRNRGIIHVPVKTLGRDTSPSVAVRNLGVVFASDFNFRQHISQACKFSFYHVHDICRILQLRPSIAQFIILKTKLSLGKRAFSVAAPMIWNELTITSKTS